MLSLQSQNSLQAQATPFMTFSDAPQLGGSFQPVGDVRPFGSFLDTSMTPLIPPMPLVNAIPPQEDMFRIKNADMPVDRISQTLSFDSYQREHRSYGTDHPMETHDYKNNPISILNHLDKLAQPINFGNFKTVNFSAPQTQMAMHEPDMLAPAAPVMGIGYSHAPNTSLFFVPDPTAMAPIQHMAIPDPMFNQTFVPHVPSTETMHAPFINSFSFAQNLQNLIQTNSSNDTLEYMTPHITGFGVGQPRANLITTGSQLYAPVHLSTPQDMLFPAGSQRPLQLSYA